jgi:hypothetical protein
LLGTLRLTSAFSRFGFIVPRAGDADAPARVGQKHRSAIKVAQDGIALEDEPTAIGKGVKDVGTVR